MDLEMMLDEDYKEGICLIDFSQIALSTASFIHIKKIPSLLG